MHAKYWFSPIVIKRVEHTVYISHPLSFLCRRIATAGLVIVNASSIFLSLNIFVLFARFHHCLFTLSPSSRSASLLVTLYLSIFAFSQLTQHNILIRVSSILPAMSFHVMFVDCSMKVCARVCVRVCGRLNSSSHFPIDIIWIK